MNIELKFKDKDVIINVDKKLVTIDGNIAYMSTYPKNKFFDFIVYMAKKINEYDTLSK